MVLRGLFRDEQTNAIIGWLLTGILVLGAIESILTGVLLWGGFEVVIIATVSVPALITGDWTAMVSWPLLAVATLSVVAGIGGFPSETAVYFAVATLALVVVIELETFTSVDLSRRFAVVFAMLTTMALQALWTVAQFYSDQWLETEYLHTQTELQWDFVIVTIIGLVLGALFQWYASQFEPAGTVARAENGAESP